MSRLPHLALLILLSLSAGGCCINHLFGGVVYYSPQNSLVFPSAGSSSRYETYDIELSFIPDARLITEDTSPHWDLGRHAVAAGEDRVILIERTTSYPDLDEDGIPIVGTMRQRKTERVWITIPKDTPLSKSLRIEELEQQFLTGYDVGLHDDKGFFKGPHLMKGFVNVIDEQCGMMVVIFDIEVRPNRPFQAENWKVEGKQTLRKSERMQVK